VERWMLLIYWNLHYKAVNSERWGSTTYKEFRQHFEKDRAL